MTEKVKPLLRGHFHQAGFFIALGASSVLIMIAQGLYAKLVCLAYAFSLCGMFAISGLYHRINWTPKARAFWRHLDHSAIFLLIAGTGTPICLLGMRSESGLRLFWVFWSMAIAGIFKELLWIQAPKWLSAGFYVIMGWAGIPYLSEMSKALGGMNISFMIAGGIIYTIGAVIYAIKKPNPFPKAFGYHEIFHILIMIAAIFHFIVIYELVTR
ncbi:MAG TPA: hemolysin III family protein [Pseudobdellovibrionaceae bacterium]|jgi:hemolysin III